MTASHPTRRAPVLWPARDVALDAERMTPRLTAALQLARQARHHIGVAFALAPIAIGVAG